MRARFLILAIFTINIYVIDAHSAPAPKPAPVETKKEHPKTIKIPFVKTPWRDVLVWLVEVSGKPVVTPPGPPAGSFTYQGPLDKEYTVAEVIALINEAFSSQKMDFIMIERERIICLRYREELVGGR